MSNSNLAKNQESGFTLVELLVVILIIGTLTAIAIPAFMNQRIKANTATLESDLRNVAMAYKTWQLNPDNNNARFHELAEGRTIHIEHPEGRNGSPATTKRWHEIPELPEMDVSYGVVIELVVIGDTNTDVNWTDTHIEGDFCLVGQMYNSDYDYVPNSGMGANNYHRILFYDNKLGGLKEIDEIIEAMEDGQDVSCAGHPNSYLRAQS